MNSEEFLDTYWSYYISIEKEFMNTFQYISLDEDNNNSFSQSYAKLIMEICSEIDVLFKEYCRFLDEKFNKRYSKIVRYRECIRNKKPEFVDQEVQLIRNDIIIVPWSEWDDADSPSWWTVYNKVKHHRTSIVKINNISKEAYKFANQEYTLLSLAGLYQLLIYYYYDISVCENKRVVVPLPGSRMFRLVGGIWKDVTFYGDYATYINDEGYLIREWSNIYY